MKKIYKTRIIVEVLSEEPITDECSLEDIGYQIMDGDWSGEIKQEKSSTLMGKTAANAIIKQGSDPEFFGLDINGKEI